MLIYLIGFMGSGKTTVGKILAEKSNSHFIDLDDAIEKQTNKSVSQIFKEDGEEVFRMEEQRALYSTSFKDKVVVACGGGTPCFGYNLLLMENYGLPIYLECEVEELYNRLKLEKQHRPLIDGLNNEALKIFIKDKLAERKKFYQQANLIVNANKSPDEIYQQILSSYM